MQYLVFLVIGLLWALYSCYCLHEENPNAWTIRYFSVFLLNFLAWWICIPIAVFARFFLNTRIIIG